MGPKGANENLGVAYCRLHRYPEALPYLREALRYIEAINKRGAHTPQFLSCLQQVRAELGEVLLRLNQSDEGLQVLREAAKAADELAARDPANAGFTQIQIEVAWRSAGGLAAWANHPSASPADRRIRLEQSQTHLDRAHTLLAGLTSESLRNFLRNDMKPAERDVAEIRSKILQETAPSETQEVSPH